MFDNIEAIKVISEGLTTVEELKDKINIIFSGDDKDAVQLSTVHRAKGLEADNVFILNPSLMPSSYAKKDWELKTEKNLIYVAYTRAKKSLNFIKEEKHYNNETNDFDPRNIKDTIETMKARLKYIEKADIIKNIAKPKKLGEKTNISTEIKTNSVPKKKNAASKLKFLK